MRCRGKRAADARGRRARGARARARALSQYHLTIEPGTVFAAAPPVQPADEIVEDMLERSLQRAARARVSSSTRCPAMRVPGARCAHNLNYWTFGDYLGVGAGAHGKISDASRELIMRTQQTREPRRYLAADPAALPESPLPSRDLPFEFAMNGFRLVEGFDGRAVRGQHRPADRHPGAGAGAAGRARPGGAGARDLARNPRRASDFSTTYWSSCSRKPKPRR